MKMFSRWRRTQKTLRVVNLLIVLIALSPIFIGQLPLAAIVVSTSLGSLVMLIAFRRWLDKQPDLVQRLGYRDTCVEARNELIQMGPESVPVLMQIMLAAPTSKGLSGWSNDLARQQAVQALEELKPVEAVGSLIAVLDDRDLELRQKAIRALGAIGNDDAVSGLLPRLLDRKMAGEVAATLRRTGKGHVLEAFCAGLEGDSTALGQMGIRYRKGMIEALLRAMKDERAEYPLDTLLQNLKVRDNAALALGEMGAVEALPTLRALVAHRSRAPASLKMTCRNAIAQLEQLVGLPREARTAEIIRETLPRAGDRPQPTTESLPRV